MIHTTFGGRRPPAAEMAGREALVSTRLGYLGGDERSPAASSLVPRRCHTYICVYIYIHIRLYMYIYINIRNYMDIYVYI